jgi:phosphocarrier protein
MASNKKDCSPPPDLSASAPVQAVIRRELVILNSRGLHARASAKLVECASRFDADIVVSRDGQSVGGRSIMGLMMLAASAGATILVEASGPEAQPAVDAITALIEARFYED